MRLMLPLTGLSALAIACIGPSGPPGEAGKDGTSCTVKALAEGLKRITCDDGTRVDVRDGANGEPCTVARSGTGVTITCPDGSTATVADGLPGGDGTGCSVSEVDGVKKITCEDGTEVVLPDGGGATTSKALVRVVEVAAGVECPGGGHRIETGVDDDDDGTLDDAEVDGTAFVCRPEVETQAPCEVFVGSISIRNTLDLQAFAALGCPVVNGEFEVNGPFEDLSSLAFLTEVEGAFIIQGTRASTLAFPNLRRVGDDVQFTNNASVTSIALPSLEETVGVRVNNAALLTNLSVPKVKTLSALELASLPVFTGAFGFTALAEVTGELSLRSMDALTSFSGLTALRRIHTLVAQQVPVLASIRLPSLRRVWSGLILEDAPNLDQCAIDAVLQPVAIKGPDFAVVDLDTGPRGCVGTKDADGDGVLNVVDNCVTAPNTAQTDTDANGTGNACQARVPGVGHLRINELLADPPDGAAGDANGDGLRDASHDEFVELVNVTDQPLLLNGVTLHRLDTGFTPAPYSANVRFTFPSITLLPGRAVVVFGGGTPTGNFGDAHVFRVAGGSGLSLTTTAYLQVVAGGVEVMKLAYNAPAAGADNVPLNAQNLSRSINRAPDVSGTSFLAHDQVTGAVGLFSPGSRVDGAGF